MRSYSLGQNQLNNTHCHPYYQIKSGWTVVTNDATSPPTWEQVTVRLETYMPWSVWLYKRVTFLSFFAVSQWVACDVCHIWFNGYSRIKVFSFSLISVERISGLRDFVFNYTFPIPPRPITIINCTTINFRGEKELKQKH